MMDSILYKRKTESVTGEHQFYFEKDYGFGVSCFYSSPLNNEAYITSAKGGSRKWLIFLTFSTVIYANKVGGWDPKGLNFMGKNPSQ